MKPTVGLVEYEYLRKGIVVYTLEKWNIIDHMEGPLVFYVRDTPTRVSPRA